MGAEIYIIVRLLDEASDKLQAIADTARDAMRAVESAGDTATQAMNSAGGAAKKSSNALTKLGRTATSLKLTPNTDGLRKVSAEATRAGGTITQSFTRAATTSSTAMNILNTTTTTAAGRAAGSMQRISTAASSAMGRVSALATSAGTRLIGAFSRAATSISGVFSRVGSAASSAFTRIRKGVSGASASLDTLSSNISGLIGAFGAAQLASESFSAAMERDMFAAYMQMNVGAAKAREIASILRQINIESPAPAGFINKLITGAIANQASLTASELRLLGQVASDYYMASVMMAKNKIDIEQDLVTYINTGNTAEMARTSILKDHVDYLGQQKTISERILALDKALKEEGYRGLSQQQRALIYWELTKDLIMEVFISLAGSVLPVLTGVMRAFVSLDEATRGWASTLVAGGVGLLVLITALPTLISLVETVSIGFSLLQGALAALPGLFAGAAGGAGLLGSAIAFLTGPIGVALLAVTAITAAFIYFYRTNESFRESVNRLGQSIMSALGGAFRWLAGVAGQVFTSLRSALQGLWGALQPVVSAVGGFLSWLGRLIVSFYTTTEGVRSLISALGPLGVWIGLLLNPIQTLRFAFQQLKMAWDQWASSAEGQATLRALGAAFNEVKLALQQVRAALQPVFDALGQAWAELSNAISPAREASGAVKSVGDSAGGASGPLQLFVDIIHVVAWILSNVVVPAISAFAEFIRFIAPAVQMLAYALSGLISVLVYIGQVVYTVFSFFYQFGQALWALLNGNITVTEFLQRVWDIFRATIGRILLQIVMSVVRFGAQLAMQAVRAGVRFVQNFVNFLRDLPRLAWLLLLLVIQRVVFWANQMYARARQTGRGVVQGVMQFLRRLPGMVWQELLNVIDKIKQAPGAAYQAAVNFGKRVWEGVKKGLGIASPGYIYKDVSDEITRVTREFKDRQDEAAASAKGFADTIVSAASIKGSTPTSSIVAAPTPPTTTNISGGMGEAANKTTAAMGQISQATTKTLTGMQRTFASKLGDVVATNTKAMNNVASTTQKGLESVRKATTTEVGNVRKSWTGMQNALTTSAVTIKNKVTGEINKLSSNMGRFWRRIQNPASLIGAGGPAGAPSIRISTGGGFAGGPTLDDLSRFLGDDDLLPICDEEPCYAGGWNYEPPWTRRALDTMYKWNFNLWGYNIPVGQFRNTSSPRIPIGAFVAMVQRIIGRTRYMFYYNSRYPSPAAALRAGAFNCYDGALIVLALARAFGLSGSMRRGYWGPFRHVWANVEGVDIDTTAIQHGYGLTSPKVHAGPGPEVTGAGGRSIGVSLDHRVSLDVNVRGEGVRSEDVASALREADLAGEVKRALVDDEEFKSRLLRVIGSAISREERYYGI